jgi:hypothetical protein
MGYCVKRFTCGKFIEMMEDNECWPADCFESGSQATDQPTTWISAQDLLDEEVTIRLVVGVEGPSIHIEDFRVAGPKASGGGKVQKEWKARRRHILKALGFE